MMDIQGGSVVASSVTMLPDRDWLLCALACFGMPVDDDMDEDTYEACLTLADDWAAIGESLAPAPELVARTDEIFGLEGVQPSRRGTQRPKTPKASPASPYASAAPLRATSPSFSPASGAFFPEASPPRASSFHAPPVLRALPAPAPRTSHAPPVLRALPAPAPRSSPVQASPAPSKAQKKKAKRKAAAALRALDMLASSTPLEEELDALRIAPPAASAPGPRHGFRQIPPPAAPTAGPRGGFRQIAPPPPPPPSFRVAPAPAPETGGGRQRGVVQVFNEKTRRGTISSNNRQISVRAGDVLSGAIGEGDEVEFSVDRKGRPKAVDVIVTEAALSPTVATLLKYDVSL